MILKQYLDLGLIQPSTDADWEKLTKTVERVAQQLTQNKKQLVSNTLTALNTNLKQFKDNGCDSNLMCRNKD